MTEPLRTYTFLPWLREGLGRRISAVDPLGADPGGPERASLLVAFTVLGTPVSNTAELAGPGDVTGLNPRAIVKTEPNDWVTNFEPNYLPFVEFYDEDLPWRYTPAHATADHRLRPWLVLAALVEDEFVDAGLATPADGDGPPRPTIAITGDSGRIFPPPDQSWAWAHVQTAEDVSAGGTRPTAEAVVALEDLVRRNPDQASSRLLCPRKLRPDTGYWAVLLPAFEVGRLAGLGQATTGQNGLAASWGAGQTHYPVYHRWYFRTAERGDFEHLVGLLEPRAVAADVGMRDMDMQRPGFGVDPLAAPPVMGLEGALRKPGIASRPAVWPPDPAPTFVTTLVEKVNLAARQLEAPAGSAPHPDPVVTLPLYGRWHGKADRLSPRGAGWVDELNADPRLRAAAGMGTRVVQSGQEGYMKRAWEQVGEVLEANRRVRYAQLAIPASYQLYRCNFATLPPAQLLAVTGPVHRRVLGGTTTLHREVEVSRLPRAALSPAFRAITRPRGAPMMRLAPGTDRRPGPMIERLNDGSLTAAPPKAAPPGQIGLDEVSRALLPSGLPGWLAGLLRLRWMRRLLAVVGLLLVLVAAVASPPVGAVAAAVMVALAALLWWLARQLAIADRMQENAITARAVAAVPARPNFAVTEPGRRPPPAGPEGPDSVEGRSFRLAATALAERLAIQPPPEPEARAVDLASATRKIAAALNPKVTIARRLAASTNVGQAFTPLKPVETVAEVMAHPSFADPMYVPLRDLSPDWLAPNLNRIANNTISLMESNQRFIEAYLVGVNHEMGRELLWREYPTDQRGSYFRQFWDVADTLPDPPGADPATIEESLRDVKKLHTWGKPTGLGTHANRDLPSGAEPGDARLVLVVRGDLLKKYPTTVVYAQRARWGVPEDPSDPAHDANQEVRLLDTDGGAGSVLSPLFKAEVVPDVHFFGFDLTASRAKGSAARIDNLPGWFFVLQERPGEPRFGLDVVPQGQPPLVTDWSKLAWDHLGDVDALHRVDLDDAPATDIPAANPDRSINWGSNAADMAYIFYQDPVMVAFHAADMLE